MKRINKRTLFWGLIGTLLLMGLFYAFKPRAVMVDWYVVKSGQLTISIREEGKTQVHDIYTLSAPVTGRLKRIDAHVGDAVVMSATTVAQIEPLDPGFLDPRSEAQAQADIQAAESARQLAEAEVSQAQAELDFAFSELARMRELSISGAISERELEMAEKTYKTQRAVVATAQAALQMRNFEAERANAAILSPTATQDLHGVCECLDLQAPVDGNILRILQKSEGVVNVGTPIMEIGNTNKLEVVIELLSSDAVQVEPGQLVLISNWGGEQQLKARVTRIEPIGFTKVSALGIEEQRVNVIADFLGSPKDWRRLGHGFQVDVEIITAELNDVLTVPIGALFRVGKDWAVYQVVDGAARQQLVQLGLSNQLSAQVTAGLKADDTVILNPGNQISDGIPVVSREQLMETR
jgi:HlyD family secretion protein